MTTKIFGAGAAPQPHDFARQLIRQLYADLDGVLFDDNHPADDAYALAADAAAAARPRGAVLIILARAAIDAHRALLIGTSPAADALAEAAAAAAVAELLPASAPQLPALLGHATNLTRYLAIAEQSSEAIHRPLARAIQRFYSALGEEDAVVGGRSLAELRSMVVHLDACACALETGGAAPEPLRVIRPDRFHDYFMQYTSLAQAPGAAQGEQAVATLTQDGRISAVITADTHPLEAAASALREIIVGDETTRDHTLARIRALLDFLDGLRQTPQAAIGDALNDSSVHLSLVIAAATAPLHASAGFTLAHLAQVACYNHRLLRDAEAASRPSR